MSEIKAIPTTYNGVEYRSRLEGDMALLLTKLGIPFQYESKSFLLDTKGIHYRPDFSLYGGAGFLEVRGYQSKEGDEQIRAFAGAIFAGVFGSMTYAALHVSGWDDAFAQHWQLSPDSPAYHREAIQDSTWWFRECPECRRWTPGVFVPRSRCLACQNHMDTDGGRCLSVSIDDGYLSVLTDKADGGVSVVRIRDVQSWEAGIQ